MSFQIESGGTARNKALVGEDGRLWTDATVTRNMTQNAERGYGFYLATNFIPVTVAAGFSGVLLFQNLSDRELHIAQIRTCGLAVTQWRLIKNPETLSPSALTDPQNTAFYSGIPFKGEMYVGADGSSFNGGSFLASWINNVGHSNTDLDGAVILGNNNTIGLEVLPSVDTTICVSILAYYDEHEA